MSEDTPRTGSRPDSVDSFYRPLVSMVVTTYQRSYGVEDATRKLMPQHTRHWPPIAVDIFVSLTSGEVAL